jgi:hypothetical protein
VNENNTESIAILERLMDHLTVDMTTAGAKESLQEAHDNLQVKPKEFQDQFEDIQAKISQKIVAD